LPHREWEASEAAMREADLVVIIGTSGVVYPAAGLPQVAKAAGARILEISPERTDLTRLADWSLRATAAEGAPAIVAAAN
ncbi:NAD-dependent protein deacylase, partial [Lactobacillus paragasseri]|nr:NAD-dependent protein deacylase [Lactobacillus paragasseri]